MTTNLEYLAYYDANAPVTSQKLVVADERAGQLVAAEVLRTLTETPGLTPEGYNNMPDWEFFIKIADAVRQASLIPNHNLGLLSTTEILTSANLGGNFFEHTYQFIIDGTAPADRIQFRKLGDPL